MPVDRQRQAGQAQSPPAKRGFLSMLKSTRTLFSHGEEAKITSWMNEQHRANRCGSRRVWGLKALGVPAGIVLLHSRAVPPLKKGEKKKLWCFFSLWLPRKGAPCKIPGRTRGGRSRAAPGVPAPATASFPWVMELACSGAILEPCKTAPALPDSSLSRAQKQSHRLAVGER